MRRAVGAAQRDVSSMGDRLADASRIHRNSSQCGRRAEVYFALALQWPLWLALRTPRDDPQVEIRSMAKFLDKNHSIAEAKTAPKKRHGRQYSRWFHGPPFGGKARRRTARALLR